MTIFSDCHWYGPTAVDVEPEFGRDIFYIGDNHEFKNIPYHRVDECLKHYSDFLKKCKVTGTHILNGNHEVAVGYQYNNIEVLLTEDHATALLHFHRESWSERRVHRWHQMDPGRSRAILFAIRMKNIIRNRLGRKKLKRKQIEICHQIAKKYRVKHVVFGHTHPRKQIAEIHHGITMVNVPRGKTILNNEKSGSVLSE